MSSWACLSMDDQSLRHHEHPTIPEFPWVVSYTICGVCPISLLNSWRPTLDRNYSFLRYSLLEVKQVVFLHPVWKWEAFPFGGTFSRKGWLVIGDHGNHILGLQNHGPDDLWKIEIWDNKCLKSQLLKQLEEPIPRLQGDTLVLLRWYVLRDETEQRRPWKFISGFHLVSGWRCDVLNEKGATIAPVPLDIVIWAQCIVSLPTCRYI